MTIEQIIVLAIVQGITEFLPISSSGHLILIPAFTGWPDQGVVADVMVHVGSLFAVIAYFWRDVLKLIGGAFDLLRLRMNDNSRMAGYIILATIPAVLFGLFLKKSGFGDNLRVLQWILDRCAGKAEAEETPIGFLPRREDLDLRGLEKLNGALDTLLTVDREGWRRELDEIGGYLDSFGDRVPEALRFEQQRVRASLG